MTAYVVNPPNDKLTDALRFGEIKYINHKYVFGDELTDDNSLPPSFLSHLRKCADEFNPDEDYLVIAGDHLQLVAFVAELSARYEDFRVLRWDRVQQAYIPVWIKTEDPVPT